MEAVSAVMDRLRTSLLLLVGLAAAATVATDCPPIVGRDGWAGRPTKSVEYQLRPVKYAIIEHTATPACTSMSQCADRVASIQAHHIDSLGFDDIGYTFLVGGDGNVYEGVGWHKVGAHARGYNTKSVGIALIGEFSEMLPSRAQLEATKKLLSCGVALGELDEEYKLLGHRQVSATKSPGLALYQEIKTWPHWAQQP